MNNYSEECFFFYIERSPLIQSQMVRNEEEE